MVHWQIDSLRAVWRLVHRSRARSVAAIAVVASVAVVCAGLTTPDVATAAPAHVGEARAATSTATTEPSVAPDAVSAETDARLSGHRVEVLSDRTETTQVFINPDLTVTRETAAAPVRVRDASAKDGWRDIDLDLRNDSDGSIRPDSALTPVAFSGGDSADSGTQLATLDPAGPGDLSVDWAGKLPTPTIDGNTATYADIASNTDLVVTATRFGFEQSFVIKKAPADPTSFALPLSVKGDDLSVTDPSSSPTSGMDVTNADGTTIGQISPATTWDDQTDEASGAPSNTTVSDMTLTTVGKTAKLDIAPSAAFLTAPGTRYPVTVDPSFSVSGASNISDTYVRSDYATTNYNGSTELDVGTYNGGTSKARAYLLFAGSNIDNTKVTSATLKLYEFHSYSCTAATMDVYATSKTDLGSATWNSGQPSLVTSTKSSVSAAKGYSSSCAAGWVSVDVTDATQYLVDSTTGLDHYSYGLRASESDSNAWKRFDSSDGTNSPVLSVSYDHYPDRVDYGTVVPSPATTYQGTRYVSSTKPTLSATFSDSDGQSAKLAFEVWDGPSSTSNTRIATCTSGAVSPGATGSCALSTALSDNKVYYVRAQAQSTYSSMNSAWSFLDHDPFSVAVSTPPTPSISCPYGNGSWTTNAPNGTVTCTVAVPGGGGTSGAMQAVIAIDGGSPTSPTFAVGAGGSFNVSVANSGGTHSISARTYSATGATQGSPTTYSFGYGSAGFTGPAPGTTTTDIVRLSATSAPRGGSTAAATLSWRPAGTSAWQDGGTVPGSAVQQGNSGSEPVTVNNYAWSTKTVVTGVGTDARKPTLIELRMCFSYSGTSMVFCTTDNGAKPLTVLRVPHAFGSGFPTATAGEGQVALWTGELALNTTDVDIKTPTGSLTVTRSHATFGQASTPTGGVFGTGFDGSFSDGSSATALEVLDSTAIDGTVSLVNSGDDSLVFREAGNGTAEMPTGTYTAVDPFTATSGDTLTIADVAGVRQVTLTGLDGSKSVWAAQSSGSTSWVPVSSQDAESHSTTTYTTSNGEVTQVLAPVPSGVTCTSSPMPAGCNALDIHYDSSNTHVTSIDYEAWNPATNARVTTRVATYTYDGSGRLSTFTNQLGLVTTYHWDGTTYPNTVLTQVDHTGQASWYYAYDYTNGKLRLKNVKRDGATSSDPQTTQTAYVYDIPTTTNGLPDLSSGTIAGWGQTDAPMTAAAVFGADHPVSSVNASDLSASDWPYADLYYTDAEGYEVDSDNYGAGQWLTTAYFYVNGQLDSTLQPSDTKAAAATGRSMDGRTITRYNADSTVGIIIPAGTYPLDTWGPVTNAVVNGTLRTVRSHTHYTYDEGAPNGNINPATGQNYNLVTTTTVGYSDPANYSTDPSATVAPDVSTVSTTTTGYDAITAGTVTSASGWTLGQPTSVTTVMPNASDNIVHKTLYDADGNIIATENPGSNGTDAGTTRTIYYTSGANSDDASCGSQPAWAGQVCLVTPAAQPESGSLVTAPIASTRTNGYDYWLDPTTLTKTAGTGSSQATQTTTYNYMLSDGRTDLSDGRLNTTAETTSNLPGSIAVPTTKVLYDPTTLTQVGLASIDSTGATTSSVKSTLDRWGRTTRYVDANGASTTTSYVPSGTAGAGSVSAVTNSPGSGSVSSTYSYDGTDIAGATEHRGLPTKVAVDGLGTYQAAYDANGNLITETMPGNVTQSRTYDSINRVVGLAYNSSAGQIVSYSRLFNGAGQVDDQSDTNGRATSFGYDAAGRLNFVADTTPGASAGTSSCTTRSYTFDPRGDRTSLASATAASCTTSGQTTNTWAYDNYSRQASGANGSGTYTYDAFGRQTAIPAADAPKQNSAATALSYFDSDAVHTITQGSTTTTYTIDPDARRGTETTGSTVVTNDYGNDTDDPVWSTSVSAGQTTTSRYVSDLAGGLAATVVTGASPVTVLQLQDLSGNTAEAVPVVQGTADTSHIVVSQFDEYGNLLSGGGSRYGWHGGAQRAVSDSGFTLMGDRLYDGDTGRFTSTDPILGGNEDAYNYPNDPIDLADLLGDMAPWAVAAEGWIGGGEALDLADDWNPTGWVIAGTLGLAGAGVWIADAATSSKGADDDHRKGGSGEFKIHKKGYKSRKAAEDAAQKAGSGKPMEHSNPERGGPHFHPTKHNGDKIPGPHYEYPKRFGARGL